MKAAFYAPMKSPRHPVPSGDRRMARLFMSALSVAGYDVELASEFRSYDGDGDDKEQARLEVQGQKIADQLINTYQNEAFAERPSLWFTYHLYHKAPDWIGPRVCKALDIPYYIAEASHAPKQKNGNWSRGYTAAQEAIIFAQKVFHMTTLDGNCLRQLRHDQQSLVHLPPFIETDLGLPNGEKGKELICLNGGRSDRFTLLCVAMMRRGDKLNSYQQLAQMLSGLPNEEWQLVIVGGGDCESQVKDLFRLFEDRVIYLGQQMGEDLQSIYAAADLYVWPACGEAFGMAFLEAQRAGTPVVAGNVRGVPDVIQNGVGGILVPEGDMIEMAQHVIYLIKNRDKLDEMSAAAKSFVFEERSLAQAAQILSLNLT